MDRTTKRAYDEQDLTMVSYRFLADFGERKLTALDPVIAFAYRIGWLRAVTVRVTKLHEHRSMD